MRPDRKAELEKIGFVFNIDKTNPAESRFQRQWDEMFEQLVNYRDEHGKRLHRIASVVRVSAGVC